MAAPTLHEGMPHSLQYMRLGRVVEELASKSFLRSKFEGYMPAGAGPGLLLASDEVPDRMLVASYLETTSLGTRPLVQAWPCTSGHVALMLAFNDLPQQTVPVF